MSKIAFLFPGQGSQYAGMGKSLAEAYPEAAHVFDQADAALGFALSNLCFEGPEDQLKLTENTQPALLTVSIAALAVLGSKGIAADYVAGHSLGEYSALVAAGSLDFADAVRLVRRRGRYMQDAVPAGVGAMAALLKLPEDKLDGVLAGGSARRGGVGRESQYAGAGGDCRPRGRGRPGDRACQSRRRPPGRAVARQRTVPLRADEARAGAAKADLDATEFRDLAIPLINNWQAREIRTGAEAREGLYRQVPNPVRWAATIRLLAASGVTRLIEVGAGSVLTGLARNIDPSLQAQKFGEAADQI